MIRIIIVEDHNVVRKGIAGWFQDTDDLTVVGEASNGRELLDLLGKGLEADVVITDMNMPEMNGVNMAKEIRNAGYLLKIIILTMLDNDKFVVQAFKAGVNGYLLKTVDGEEIIFAVRHIHRGNRYICSGLSTRLLDRLINIPRANSDEDTSVHAEFTEREVEILLLISRGYTNQQIADQLFTSKRTIEGHRQSMLEKTESKNVPELIRYAFINKLID